MKNKGLMSKVLVALVIVVALVGLIRFTRPTATSESKTTKQQTVREPATVSKPVQEQAPQYTTKQDTQQTAQIECGLFYKNNEVFGPAADYPDKGKPDGQTMQICGKEYKWIDIGWEHLKSTTPGANPAPKDIGGVPVFQPSGSTATSSVTEEELAQLRKPVNWPKMSDYNSVAAGCPGYTAEEFPYKKLGTGLTLDLTPTKVPGFEGRLLHILPSVKDPTQYTYGIDGMEQDFLAMLVNAGMKPPEAMGLDVGIGDEKLYSTYHFGDVSSALCNGEIYVSVDIYPNFETMRWEQ